MGDPVTNFEINSADPAKARRFYTAVLGWKMNEVPQTGYTFVDTDAGGKGIGGGIGPLRGPKPFVTFYIVVRDLNATLKKATDAGAKAVCPLTNMFWGDRYGMVQDPFGHVWALATHVEDLTQAEIEERAKQMFAHAK